MTSPFLNRDSADVEAVVCALGTLLDLRDLGTGVHSTQIVELALQVGAHFGLETCQMRELEIAASLHDIGKVGIPDAVLHKQSALDEAETAVMRRHPEYGWAILRQLPGLSGVALCVLHHHERWDGGGYPGRLRGEGIPLGSRIVCAVDAFHAMISDRPYRPGMPVAAACERLLAGAGSQFDPAVVTVFAAHARLLSASAR